LAAVATGAGRGAGAAPRRIHPPIRGASRLIIAHPQILWLLLLAPLMGAASAALMRRRHLSRRAAIALIRSGCFAALVLALARPLLRYPNHGRETIVVADLSASVPDGEIATIADRLRALRL